MNILSLIYQSFSNREKAIILWIIIILCYVQYKDKNFYKVLLKLLKSIFWSKITIYIIILGIISIMTFNKLIEFKIIEYSFTKDFIYWFFGVALHMFFSLNRANNKFFLYEIKNLIKLEIIIQIFINLVSFSIIIEIIILPIIFIFVVMPIFIEHKDDIESKNQVIILCNVIIYIIGIILIIYNIKHTFKNYKLLFNLYTLQSVLVPILLTICIIPYLYILAVIMKYETIFIILKIWNKTFTFKDKIEVIKFNHISLKKIINFWKNFDKFEYRNSENMREYILKTKNKN